MESAFVEFACRELAERFFENLKQSGWLLAVSF